MRERWRPRWRHSDWRGALPSGVWTFGLKRAEILSAQANGITLLVIGALVAFEAIRRLIYPSRVNGALVIGVAVVGARRQHRRDVGIEQSQS